MRTPALVTALLACLCCLPTAQAQDSGMFAVRLRSGSLAPVNSDASGLGLKADSKTTTAVDLSVFLDSENALELALITPPQHTLHSTSWAENVASIKQAPVTLIGQHHFNGVIGVRPYLGLGLAYTHFSSIKVNEGLVMDFKRSSLGLAAQIGVDVPLRQGWMLNIDVKKLQSSTRVILDGFDVGRFKLDPTLLSVGVGYRF